MKLDSGSFSTVSLKEVRKMLLALDDNNKIPM